MRPLVTRQLTALLLLVLLGPAALAADRPAGAGRSGSSRNLPDLPPFLDVFLSQHQVTVVTRPVEWISAIGKHQGLLAREESNDRLPALLLIEDRPASEFGKRTAVELAGIGYVVLLLGTERDRAVENGGAAREVGEALRREQAIARISAAVRWLRRREDVYPDRIGALGRKDSAPGALLAAAAGGLQAAVLIDPPLPLAVDADLSAGLRHTAVLIVRGTADASLLDGEYLARLGRWLQEADIAHRVLEFDEAKTGFLDGGQLAAPEEEAADAAWFQIYEHLAGHVEDVAINKLLAAKDGPPAGRPLRHFSSIADLMRSVNAPTGVRGTLAKSLSAEPSSEKDWQQPRASAALMAEAGELLLDLRPPKGSPARWKQNVAAYRDAAAGIAAAADRRDYSAARQALARLNTSCGKCHLEHR